MARKRTIEQSMLGDEPTFDGAATNADIMRAFNYYNYKYSIRETKKWITAWMKDTGYTTKEISGYNSSGHPEVNQTMASIARMFTRGLTDKRLNEVITDHIKSAIDYQEEQKIKKIRPSQFNEVIADIDEILDEFYLTNYKDVLEFEVSPESKSADIKSAYRHYSDLLAEVREGEGYERLKKAQKNRYIETLENVVKELALKGAITTRRKTVRKKRAPNAQKIVSKVKYLQNFENYASLDPTVILDSNVIYLYNSKTRQLAKYTAPPGQKLNVKGTTLNNVNTRVQYKLRKPDDILPNIITGSRRDVDREIKSIKTKPSEPSGRLNDTTLILRAFK